MKLGVSGQILGTKYDLAETLRIIRGYQVDHIEIWPCNIAPVGEVISPDSYEGRDVASAAKILKENGMQVSAVSFSGAFNRELTADPDKYSEELCRTVEVAHALGARFVNHYCYYLSMEELDFGRLHRCFDRALELAQRLGVDLVLENEAHDQSGTARGMLKILEEFDHPSFKTNFDATNYYHASEEGYPYAYQLLKPHIGYVHLKNGSVFHPELGDSETFRGAAMSGAMSGHDIYYPFIWQGAVNIDGLLERLKQDDYEGFCVLEPHCPVEHIPMFLLTDLTYIRKRCDAE